MWWWPTNKQSSHTKRIPTRTTMECDDPIWWQWCDHTDHIKTNAKKQQLLLRHLAHLAAFACDAFLKIMWWKKSLAWLFFKPNGVTNYYCFVSRFLVLFWKGVVTPQCRCGSSVQRPQTQGSKVQITFVVLLTNGDPSGTKTCLTYLDTCNRSKSKTKISVEWTKTK